MQDPTIHITLSSLKKVLGKLSVMFPSELAEEILERSQPYAIRDRFVVTVKGTAKEKKVKKAEKFSVSEEDVELFNQLLTSYRKSNNHKFIPIRREDVMWKTLSEVTHDAIDFCNTMEYKDKSIGMLRYITKGIDMMRGKYGLNKFKSYRDRIVEEESMERILVNDNDPWKTEQFTTCYVQLMAKESGVVIDKEYFTTTKRVELLYGRLCADDMKISYVDYLKAQFAELNFMGGVPETSHLYGDNAKHRAKSYLAKRGVEAKDMEGSGGIMEYYKTLKKNK